MALWKTKDANTLRVAFAIVRNGALQTGITSGITVTLLAPTMTTDQALTPVTESSAKGGIYWVDVPTAFLSANGLGHYALVIEVATTGPKINDVDLQPLEIVAQDIDDIPTSAQIRDAVFARTMETGFDFDRMIRIVAAAVAGKVTGSPGLPVFRNLADTIDQITGTAVASGDRDPVPTYGA